MQSAEAPDGARVAASPRPTHQVRIGEAEVDLARRRAMLDGRPVRLTPREWRLLELLLQHRPRAMPHAELGERLTADGRPVNTGSVIVHVYNLRKKLGRDAIETIRGRGVRVRA